MKSMFLASWKRIGRQAGLSAWMACFLIGCRPGGTPLEQALSAAGSNRPQLEAVLEACGTPSPGNRQREAAEFLIAHMPGHYAYDFPGMAGYYGRLDSLAGPQKLNDLQKHQLCRALAEAEAVLPVRHITLKPDVEHIDTAYLLAHLRQAMTIPPYPWRDSTLTFADFCEYILPYRILNEPLTGGNWSSAYREHLRPLADSLARIHASDSLVCEALRCTMTHLRPPQWVNYSFKLKFPAVSLLDKGVGRCPDLSMLSVFALRSLGIAAAMDFTPQWGNRSLGHDWCSAYVGGRWQPFQLGDAVPVGEHFSPISYQVMPKVYRHMYSRQPGSLCLLGLDEEVYPLFREPFLKDVSALYFTPHDAVVPVGDRLPVRRKHVYLAVFNDREWVPVQWGLVDEAGNATFRGMAAGCAYLPVLYHDRQLFPIGTPFYLTDEGRTVYFAPDTARRVPVSLYRKYPPHRYRQLGQKVVGGCFQVANRPDFSDAVTIYRITSVDTCRLPAPVAFDSLPPCRYFRYMSAERSHVYMAEVGVYDEAGHRLMGQIIGTDGSFANNGMDKTKMFDDDPLTYYNSHIHTGCWAGLAFDRPRRIGRLTYVPANDDNFIRCGDEYELFYYDRGWVSLGRQTGTEEGVLHYEAPAHALLLLRDLTRGKEERIFTYENGKQEWK